MHGISDITGIAIVAVAAMLCGMAMVRLRQPAIIGYIFAGLILGPNGLSLVENRETIDLLAQLGVIMLLFFIGMELSLRSFRTIWKVAIISALAQIGLSVGALYILGGLFEWPVEWAILFGFCLALSSTAVAVKVLEETGELRNNTGRLTVGILIAQDLAVCQLCPCSLRIRTFRAVLKMITNSNRLRISQILSQTKGRSINRPMDRKKTMIRMA